MHPLKVRSYRLLRFLERYTKTDMVYLTSGGFWLFAGQALSALSALILAVAFANLVEPEKYGNYKYILSLAGIIGTLTLTGFGTAVARGAARGYSGTLSYAFQTALQWSVAMLIVSVGIGTYYFLQGNILLGSALFIIGATAPVIAASSFYRPYLMGSREFKRATLYGALQSTGPALAVLCGVLLQVPFLLLILIYFVSSAAACFTLYSLAARSAGGAVDPEASRIGKHLSVMNIISVIAGRLDNLLLFQLLGGTHLAVFAFAVAIPDTIRGSFKNFASLAMPKFIGKSKVELKESVSTKSILIFFGATTVTGAYILAAPYIFQLFFPVYLESVVYSQVYAVTLLFTLILSTAYFDAQKGIKERYILSTFSSIVTILTAVVGIYWFGLWGAVWARIVARILIASASAILIARH